MGLRDSISEWFKEEFLVCHWLCQCAFLREKVRSPKRFSLITKE